MSEPIHIFEEVWFTPPEQDDILPYPDEQSDQVWKRPNINKEFTEEEISLEYKRRRDGVWFMNNGEPTYITGEYYFYLTYCRFSFGYPQYRNVDRMFFYAWQTAVDDPNCLGLIRPKFRRTGASSQGASMMLNAGSMTEGINIGIISETSVKAGKVFRNIVDVMQTIPEIFIPALESRDRPKKQISFREPSKIMGGKKKERSKLSLNTTIDYGATTINSYDGSELYRLMIDEAGKYPTDAPFDELWEIHKTTLIHGAEIFGKAYIPSTINELTKGGTAFKKVWEDSDPYLKDKNGVSILEKTGSTSSGLKRLFVPAYDGLQGFIDKYGFSVIENPTDEQSAFIGRKIGAREYLQQEIDKISDPNRRAERQRQFPMNIREAFSLNNKLSPFNIEKLSQQFQFNEDNTNLTVRGDFAWIEKFKSVQWMPSPTGRFLTSWIPPVELRNKIDIIYGKPSPANINDGCFGLDPFSHNVVLDKRRSDAALYGIKKPYPANPVPIFFLEYIFRPSTVEALAEDVAMACIFYGMPVLGESNKPEVMNRFISWGLEHYLMDRPYENQSDYSRAMRAMRREKWLPNTGGVNSSLRSTFVSRMQTFVYNNVGINDETGEMGRMYFNRLIEDLMLFDPEEAWTPFDAFVGAVYALSGTYKFVPEKVQQPFIPYVPSFKKKKSPFESF